MNESINEDCQKLQNANDCKNPLREFALGTALRGKHWVTLKYSFLAMKQLQVILHTLSKGTERDRVFGQGDSKL